jgi:proteasome lid subunit RPN8/RPN11
MLTSSIKASIKNHSSFRPHEETCGVLFYHKDDKKIMARPCQNISPEPDKHFQINPYEYLYVANKLGNIVGYYHSQDESEPSELDLQNCKGHNLYSVIYCKKEDKFIELWGNEYNYVEKYIGKKFDVYKFDCYQLTKDYYKNELNIILPEFQRDENWYTNIPKLIEDNWSKHFIEVEDKQKNDILLFKIGHDYISHMGIYLGGNLMLHVELDRESKVEIVGHKWLKRLEKVIRYGR